MGNFPIPLGMDGVLFYDTETDGRTGYSAISDIREYVFTEWGARRSRNGPGDRFRQRTREAQGTAKDDLAALRSRFDKTGDGKLTLDELDGSKVMKTNADGSLSAVTLASLNITQINLTRDKTHNFRPALQSGGQCIHMRGR